MSNLNDGYINKYIEPLPSRQNFKFKKTLNMLFNKYLLLLLLLLLLLGSVSVIHGRTEDVEVIFLPTTSSSIQDEVPLAFTAFGHTIELKLQKNYKLLAPSFKVWRHKDERAVEEMPELNEPEPCHYLHRDSFSTAAISLCEQDVINGLVLLDNAALEITPLRETKSPSFLDRLPLEGETKQLKKKPHVVKRSYLSSIISNNSHVYDVPNNYINFAKKLSIKDAVLSRSGRSRLLGTDLTIELAVFFDETAYNIFVPFLDRDEKKIRDMLLAYINGVQALFYHPSLGAKIDLALVRLDIMEKQPVDLPDYNGERGRLLDSFCSYVEKHNPPGDDHPSHWDMALYVSGLDFYAADDGSRATMGLAPVNGTCYEPWSCVIAELGVTNRFGKPYPSAGFTSVYIAAHEMGHNLGMRHDSVGNSCAKDGFIMSPSRGTKGETIWSSCSQAIALKLYEEKPCLWDKPSPENKNDPSLDHYRHVELPGREWTSKRQCELLLKDKDATVATLSNACQSLQCKSPHRSGFYFAGPALDGTLCAQGKECRGGDCLSALEEIQHNRPPKISEQPIKIGWSKWKEDPCKSGCIKKSKGAKARRRVCRESQKMFESGKSPCDGFPYDVLLCKDEKLCKKRWNPVDFAGNKCNEFSEYLPELESDGGGLQAPHENSRLWMACAIFCKRSDIASYYTPRIELNDLGLDPYFPDGTWCHNENGQDYFCLQHHCLPETFRFGKDFFSRYNDDREDSIIGPQNAGPENYKIPDQLVKYLSIGNDGLPILKNLPFRTTTPSNEDAWIDKDYFELPEESSSFVKENIFQWNTDDSHSRYRHLNIL